MNNLASFDGRRLIKILKRFEFEVVRIKGGHYFLKHPDGRVTVVPVHGKENTGVGLFYKI